MEIQVDDVQVKFCNFGIADVSIVESAALRYLWIGFQAWEFISNMD